MKKERFKKTLKSDKFMRIFSSWVQVLETAVLLNNNIELG
jgi:hypothetical protein